MYKMIIFVTHLKNIFMAHIKVSFVPGDAIWFQKDGKPFEDKIAKVEVSATKGIVIEKYTAKELGEVDVSTIFKSKRELAVALGFADPIIKKAKEKKD
jgi:hypothetical protein